MKNRGKRNRIWAGLLVLVLITGMFVGNGITAAAAGGTTHHFCDVWTDASHNHKLEEGTILYPGDVLCVGSSSHYDFWAVYVDGTRVVSARDQETNWSVDATYIVTERREHRGAYDEAGGVYEYHHRLYLETYTAPEAAPVAAVKEPAWLLEFKEDYARMLKDINEAESGASVEIDATVWHSFSAK